MRILLLTSVLCAFALTYASPSPRAGHVVHERRAAEPVGWVKARRLESDKVLPIRIGLKQNNVDQLEELLTSISHPDSPTYGQHWSPEQVIDFFAPSDDAVKAVKSWLANVGLASERIHLSKSKGWVEVNVTVSEAEEFLDTEYHVYTHPTGVEQISCEMYSVPEHVREHVELIQPTVHFNHRVPVKDPSHIRRKRENRIRVGTASSFNGPKTNGIQVTHATTLDECDQFITLDCLRALYSINRTPKAAAKNSYGIVEFTPQAFLASDLDLFFKNFSKTQIGDRPKLISIDGGFAQTQNQSFNFNGESDLDLEYAMALTNPQEITLLQTGDIPEGASFNNWLDAVDGAYCTFEGGDDPTQDGIYPDPLPGGFDKPESCGIVKPPNVVSVSYGQDESTTTPFYAMRQCTEYGKLGMMGTTVLYSSGDDGVAGFGGVCLPANGTGEPSVNGTRFNPSFPGGCPFVTSVGATQVNPGSTVFEPEGACEQVIFSGGGFSNIFPLPSFQAAAVTSFLKNTPPPYTAEQFNNSGKVRAFPDLSANGANYVIAIDGEFELVFGTSASSPVVGSIITLINDARLQAGKGPVGFINPAIYTAKFASAFHDITMGGNQGCSTPGFESTKGWDPVTGVGTPNMTALIPLFLSLP